MSMMRICDSCKKLVENNRHIVKVLEQEENTEPRDARVIANYDLHKECAAELIKWMMDGNKEGI